MVHSARTACGLSWHDRSMLDAAARAAVHAYSLVGATVNADLRRGETSDLVDALDRAFDLVEPTTSPRELWRGVAEVIDHGPGDEIIDRAFGSMTRFRAIAEFFAVRGTLLKIVVPSGARLIDVNRLGLSEYPAEREVLAPRGFRLVVMHVIPSARGPAVIECRMELR